jgi:hypothetical protein
LITFCYAYGIGDTAVALSSLRAAGIVVVPTCWHAGFVNWHLTYAFGGIELRVPASQAEAAIAIVSGIEPQMRRHFGLAIVTAMALILLGALIPPPPSGLFPARAAATRLEADQ